METHCFAWRWSRGFLALNRYGVDCIFAGFVPYTPHAKRICKWVCCKYEHNIMNWNDWGYMYVIIGGKCTSITVFSRHLCSLFRIIFPFFSFLFPHCNSSLNVHLCSFCFVSVCLFSYPPPFLLVIIFIYFLRKLFAFSLYKVIIIYLHM